jgi:hypothetical protein
LVLTTGARGLARDEVTSVHSNGVRARLETLVLQLLGGSGSGSDDAKKPASDSIQKSTVASQQSLERRSTCGWYSNSERRVLGKSSSSGLILDDCVYDDLDGRALDGPHAGCDDMAQRRGGKRKARSGPRRLALAAQKRGALIAQTLEERVAQREVGLVAERLEAGLPAVVLEDVHEVLQARGAVELARGLDEH